jgi:hypothetical protein
MGSKGANSQMRNLNLEEETKQEFAIDEDLTETLNALKIEHRKKFRFGQDWTRNVYTLQPRGYVGYIPVGKDCHLFINQKLK